MVTLQDINVLTWNIAHELNLSTYKDGDKTYLEHQIYTINGFMEKFGENDISIIAIQEAQCPNSTEIIQWCIDNLIGKGYTHKYNRSGFRSCVNTFIKGGNNYECYGDGFYNPKKYTDTKVKSLIDSSYSKTLFDIYKAVNPKNKKPKSYDDIKKISWYSGKLPDNDTPKNYTIGDEHVRELLKGGRPYHMLRFNANGEEILFINVHLPHNDNNGNMHEYDIFELNRIIAAKKITANRIIMAGDFNRNIEDVTLTVGDNNLRLTNVIKSASRKPTCCSSFNKIHNKTTKKDEITSLAKNKHNLKYDHVLDSKYNNTTVFDNEHESRGSDHRPVYVKLKH